MVHHPSFISSQEEHTKIVNLLLKSNANPNLPVDSITPLFIASQEGHHDIARLLLNANANPNVYTDDGITPLMIASFTAILISFSFYTKKWSRPRYFRF